jgi:diguanylate cyclase (GGDEF)-like protein
MVTRMTKPHQDARLQEMQFLAHLAREGEIKINTEDEATNRPMIVSLIYNRYINDIDSMNELQRYNWSDLERAYKDYRDTHIKILFLQMNGPIEGARIQTTHSLNLRISHKGRVRLSELQQQLTSGRERDRFGILISGRHVEIDLTVAALSAGQKSPVSIAYLDMNGLKQINDTHGHATADEVIRSYLGAVSTAVAAAGEAYRRYDGGDEVVVIMRSTSAELASNLMRGLLRQLTKERVILPGGIEIPTITASCGIETTVSAEEDAKGFLDRADKTMQRAKEWGKTRQPRESTVALGAAEPFAVGLATST